MKLKKYNQFSIKYNPIYVWVDYVDLNNILENGIRFNINDDDRYNYKYSISSTRNPNWKWGGGNCRITLDRDEISDFFKITPYSHYGFKEWEERIFSNRGGYLSPKFFKKIEIDENIEINNNLEKYNLPINRVNFFKKRITSAGGKYGIKYK